MIPHRALFVNGMHIFLHFFIFFAKDFFQILFLDARQGFCYNIYRPAKAFLREKQGERRQPDEQNDNENSPTAQQRSRQADTAYATSLAAPAYAPEAPAYTAPVEAAPVAPAEPAPAPKAEEKDAFGEYDDVINFIRKSKK